MLMVTLSCYHCHMRSRVEKIECSPWVPLPSRDWLSGLEMRLLTIRRTRKSMRGRVGTSPWPTSLLSLSHPPWVSSWDRKPMMHMATSQFMWELISSLPVSGKLWKGLRGTSVIHTLQQCPSNPGSSCSPGRGEGILTVTDFLIAFLLALKSRLMLFFA